MMANLHDESGLLRVAHPRECNTQQIGESGADSATARATGAQQGGIKALALRALAGNSGATAAQQPVAQGGKGAQQPPSKSVALLRCPRDATTQQADDRLELIRLAKAAGIDERLVLALSDEDLTACAGLSETSLHAYLLAARDADLRQQGKRPPDETAAAMCRRCGPVWLHPAVTAAPPVIDGWPRVLGCPWCHLRNPRLMPRPTVQCRDCQHFIPDPENSEAGLGRCGKGLDVLAFALAPRQCDGFCPEVAP